MRVELPSIPHACALEVNDKAKIHTTFSSTPGTTSPTTPLIGGEQSGKKSHECIAATGPGTLEAKHPKAATLYAFEVRRPRIERKHEL